MLRFKVKMLDQFFPHLARLSTFAAKTPADAGVSVVGHHYTAFRDDITGSSKSLEEQCASQK